MPQVTPDTREATQEGVSSLSLEVYKVQQIVWYEGLQPQLEASVLYNLASLHL